MVAENNEISFWNTLPREIIQLLISFREKLFLQDYNKFTRMVISTSVPWYDFHPKRKKQENTFFALFGFFFSLFFAFFRFFCLWKSFWILESTWILKQNDLLSNKKALSTVWKSTDFFCNSDFCEIDFRKLTKLEKRNILDNMKTSFSPKLKFWLLTMWQNWNFPNFL